MNWFDTGSTFVTVLELSRLFGAPIFDLFHGTWIRRFLGLIPLAAYPHVLADSHRKIEQNIILPVCDKQLETNKFRISKFACFATKFKGERNFCACSVTRSLGVIFRNIQIINPKTMVTTLMPDLKQSRG